MFHETLTPLQVLLGVSCSFTSLSGGHVLSRALCTGVFLECAVRLSFRGFPSWVFEGHIEGCQPAPSSSFCLVLIPPGDHNLNLTFITQLPKWRRMCYKAALFLDFFPGLFILTPKGVIQPSDIEELFGGLHGVELWVSLVLHGGVSSQSSTLKVFLTLTYF